LKKHDENEPISNEISDDTPASPYVVNHLAIVWLSIAAVWLLAAAAYVILRVCNVQLILPFAVALFVTSILLIIFNSLWGKRTFVFWTISLLVWSILFLICYIFKSYNPWLLMILGFPAMLVILLACRVKTRKKDE